MLLIGWFTLRSRRFETLLDGEARVG